MKFVKKIDFNSRAGGLKTQHYPCRQLGEPRSIEPCVDPVELNVEFVPRSVVCVEIIGFSNFFPLL